MVKDRMLVFIVDDNPIYRELLDFELSAVNDLSVKSFDCFEACFYDLTDQPDMIVMDYNLNADDTEAITGYQAVTAMQDAFPEAKIIIISATSDHTIFEFYRAQFGIEFVPKPKTGNEEIISKVLSEMKQFLTKK